MTPQRVQMSRQHPWRAGHPDAVIVDRRTRWGNRWRVTSWLPSGAWVRRWSVWDTETGETRSQHDTQQEATEMAVAYFREDVARYDLTALIGRDLACWCPPDQACHADVLLEIANGGAS